MSTIRIRYVLQLKEIYASHRPPTMAFSRSQMSWNFFNSNFKKSCFLLFLVLWGNESTFRLLTFILLNYFKHWFIFLWCDISMCMFDTLSCHLVNNIRVNDVFTIDVIVYRHLPTATEAQIERRFNRKPLKIFVLLTNMF
jgi:hypothetical protein